MKCFFVPDKLLKTLNDPVSLRLSQRIRSGRTKVKSFVQSLVQGVEVEFKRNRQTYTCKNTTNTPGTLLLKEEDSTSSNINAMSAHLNAGIVWDFYSKVLGRNSIDNNGLTIISSVNYSNNYNNAFWDGQQMVYGDGDGKLFKNFPDDLTVDGHEMTHGVTQNDNSGGLWYYYQSGALNEAISDIFGVTIRQWHENQTDPKTANWLIGDKCVGSDFPGTALRTMVPDVPAYKGDDQPSNMKNFKYMTPFEDNGGVHTNSKIPNVVFYRMCQNLGVPSWDKPIKIVYHAYGSLNHFAGFKTWGKALVASAGQLYGANEQEAVRKALLDTGIKV